MPISWYLVFKDIQLMQVTLTKISRSECESTVMAGKEQLHCLCSEIICTEYTRGQSHRGQGLCWTFFSKVHLTTSCRMDEYSMAEEHLKYVFKGSLHYLCWLGVILVRGQQILLSQQRLDVVNFGKNMKKKNSACRYNVENGQLEIIIGRS